MVKIIFIDSTGVRREVNAMPGMSIMQSAISNRIPGIDGDCGGNCACGTCHIFIEPEWLEKVGRRTESEDAMLAFSTSVSPASRLACQIEVSPALDGLTVKTPEHQY
jgi:2Fe-2S ferredoxin